MLQDHPEALKFIMGMFTKKADQVLEGCHNWCQLLMRGLKPQFLPPGCSGGSNECCEPPVSKQMGNNRTHTS